MNAPLPSLQRGLFGIGGVMTQLSIGQGFDAHRFSEDPERELWIAGLQWTGEGSGIEGDSDGDVAVHALIDAMLSAAGLGDIGSLFGVGTTSHGSGMHGLDMLRETVATVRRHGAELQSASVVVIGNRPKIGRRRDEAQQVLGNAMGCPVSVTATTTDHMGFTGSGEGVAAIANCLVLRSRNS